MMKGRKTDKTRKATKMESKFKIGDMVKLMDRDYHTYGNIGVVIGVSGELYEAKCIEDGCVLNYWDCELEPVADNDIKIVITSDDTFEFGAGAIPAFQRMMDTEKQKSERMKIKERKISKIELIELFKVKDAIDRYTDIFGARESNTVQDKIWSVWESLFDIFCDNNLYFAYNDWHTCGKIPDIEVIETYEDGEK